jgi:hypothetical protein
LPVLRPTILARFGFDVLCFEFDVMRFLFGRVCFTFLKSTGDFGAIHSGFVQERFLLFPPKFPLTAFHPGWTILNISRNFPKNER